MIKQDNFVTLKGSLYERWSKTQQYLRKRKIPEEQQLLDLELLWPILHNQQAS